MRYWSFYFFAKLALFYGDRLNFHWRENLLLALVLLWPLQAGRLNRLCAWLSWPLALALLYYDSYLPSLERVLSQVTSLANFRLDYLLELLERAVDTRALAAGLGVFVLYALLARRIRFAPLAFAGILSVPLLPLLQTSHASPAWGVNAEGAPGSADAAAQTPDAFLQAFYAEQAQRKLSFAGTQPLFDIIVLQVCSLSWDDLEFVGMREHPLFQRFDVLFTQFNSAASYSGPAALRLTRGACGQSTHQDLYDGANPACYLFPSLEQLGYHTQGLLNHDGEFDEFAKMLEERSGMAGKLEMPTNAPIAMRNFDGSPIFSDAALLRSWWRQHQQAHGQKKAALYYNTVSLHDGNHVEGIASRSSLDTYKPRLSQLLSDFDQFITELESTGRPVLLLLMPEHGAALRGDRFQISGMREIPNPRITLVPVGMKLIGMPHQHTQPIVNNTPVSYYGINALILDMLQDSPLDAAGTTLEQRLQKLQPTPFVSENADVIMLRNPEGSFLMRSGKRSAWVNYVP